MDRENPFLETARPSGTKEREREREKESRRVGKIVRLMNAADERALRTNES